MKTTNERSWATHAGAPVLAIVWCLCAAGARGSVQTLGECLEGSDFIANAAVSRDNGKTRTAFLDRLDEDIAIIRAFPVPLRWFVKDEDDGRFLRAAAESVYDLPASPDAHRADFLRACVARLTAAIRAAR